MSTTVQNEETCSSGSSTPAQQIFSSSPVSSISTTTSHSSSASPRSPAQLVHSCKSLLLLLAKQTDQEARQKDSEVGALRKQVSDLERELVQTRKLVVAERQNGDAFWEKLADTRQSFHQALYDAEVAQWNLGEEEKKVTSLKEELVENQRSLQDMQEFVKMQERMLIQARMEGFEEGLKMGREVLVQLKRGDEYNYRLAEQTFTRIIHPELQSKKNGNTRIYSDYEGPYCGGKGGYAGINENRPGSERKRGRTGVKDEDGGVDEERSEVSEPPQKRVCQLGRRWRRVNECCRSRDTPLRYKV